MMKTSKKVICLLLTLIMVVSSLPTMSFTAEAGTTVTPEEIIEMVSELPEPVNYNKYNYVPVNTSDFADGQYIIYNAGTNTVMQDRIVASSSIPAVSYNRNIQIEYASSDEIPDDYLYTITNKGNGYYSILNSHNKYLSILRYGILQETNDEKTLLFTPIETDTGLCFQITSDMTNGTCALSMYSNTWFTSHYKNDGNGQHMRFLKKEISISINNNTTDLYKAICKAQHYYNYNVSSTLLSAIEYYKKAYNGGVTQSILDNYTSQLNSIINNNKAAYEAEVKKAEQDIEDLFTGEYNYLNLKSSVNQNDVASLKNRATLLGLSDEYIYKANKAYKLANGGIIYDSEREFVPERYGDVRQIAYDIYKFPYFGTYKQPTGIWTDAGRILYVYVQAEENDPLPGLIFTQHVSNGYQQEEIQLKKGMNIVHTPYIFMSSMQVPVENGGLVYIKNPYTKSVQSSNVKVYIEGGDKVPVYSKGENVPLFRRKLADYYAHYKKGDEGYHDAIELWGEHSFMTVMMETCYKAFCKEGLDPENTLVKWDEFIEYMMGIAGISNKNEYEGFRLQVKVNQPYAGAYATLEMICIQDNVWLTSLLAGRYGWGFPHEVGHTIDNRERLYPEKTNNVWSMKSVLDNEMFSNIAIPKTEDDMKEIAPDDSNTFWSDETSKYANLSMFWDLEVYQSGFWGKLDGMFRANTCGITSADAYISNLDQKEKIVAYASKAIGINLVYYFQKYGFISSPSANLTGALAQMQLSSIKPKIWYYDVYSYYDNTSSNIGKNGSISVASYESGDKRLTFDLSLAFNDAHLGFEIIRDGKVVGFTWRKYFDDTTASSGDCDYTINAYDRSLNKYASTTFYTSNTTTDYVARIGEKRYQSLSEAISNANSGDIIYVNKSCVITSSLSITKNITILPENNNKSIYIYKGTVFDLFYINGGSLTLGAVNGTKGRLIIDGNIYSSNYWYSMFSVHNKGYLTINKGVIVQNFRTYTNAGGIIYANDSNIFLKGCIIEHNNCKNGTIYIENGSSLTSSDNTIIRYNCVSGKGGAICVASVNDSVSLTDTEIYKNSSANEEAGSTINLENGTLNIKKGTSIHDNFSDGYDRYTAVLASASAKVNVSGSVNITDFVNAKSPVNIDYTFTGKLVLRVPSDIAELGFEAAVPTSGSFSPTISNYVTYANDLYELSYSASALTLRRSASGDVNGDNMIDLLDAYCIYLYINDPINNPLTEDQLSAANINKDDNSINLDDVQALLDDLSESNSILDSCTLTVSGGKNGTVHGAASGRYVTNSKITVIAVPETNYTVSWLNGNGEIVSTDTSYTFTINEDTVLTATFTLEEPIEYIYYYNSLMYKKPYLHAWETGGAVLYNWDTNDESMTLFDSDYKGTGVAVYVYALPAGSHYDNVIIHDYGKENVQSPDLKKYGGDSTGKNNMYDPKAKTWIPYGSNVPKNNYVYFSAPTTWGNIRIHAWEDGGAVMTTWENDPYITYIGKNSYGQKIYEFDLPSNYNRIIFRDNNNQTKDIIRSTEHNGYYVTDSSPFYGYYDFFQKNIVSN